MIGSLCRRPASDARAGRPVASSWDPLQERLARFGIEVPVILAPPACRVRISAQYTTIAISTSGSPLRWQQLIDFAR
jgi:hypothetical protein